MQIQSRVRTAPLLLSFVVLGEAFIFGDHKFRHFTLTSADVSSSPHFEQRCLVRASGRAGFPNRKRKLSFVDACEISAAEAISNSMERAATRQEQEHEQDERMLPPSHLWLPQDDLESMRVKVRAPPSRNMRRFVDDTSRPAGKMFCDYKEMGIDKLMVEAKGGTLLMSYYLEVQSNLTSHLGRTPTVDEWACSLNMAAQDLKLGIIKSQEVKAALLERFGGLVRKTAISYRGMGVPLRDLMQEGSCGLIHAAERFDPTLGFKFTTYARHWIRKHVSRAVGQHSRLIRLPQRAHEQVVAMGRVRGQMTVDLGRDPTLSELAKHPRVSLNEKAARNLVGASAPVISLESKHANNNRDGSDVKQASLEQLYLKDTTSEGPEQAASRALFRAELAHLLGVLPSLERHVIELRFGLLDGKPLSYEDVIRRSNTAALATKKDVKAAELRALYKLRRPSTMVNMAHLKEALYQCSAD